MAGKRVREPWEKCGSQGREVEALIGLLDSLSQDQWITVGRTERGRNRSEFREALDQWHKVKISATLKKALSSLADRYRPQYDKSAVDRYTRGGIREAKGDAIYTVGIADRLPAWAVEVLLCPFVKAGVDLSVVLPEGMDISHPLPDEA